MICLVFYPYNKCRQHHLLWFIASYYLIILGKNFRLLFDLFLCRIWNIAFQLLYSSLPTSYWKNKDVLSHPKKWMLFWTNGILVCFSSANLITVMKIWVLFWFTNTLKVGNDIFKYKCHQCCVLPGSSTFKIYCKVWNYVSHTRAVSLNVIFRLDSTLKCPALRAIGIEGYTNYVPRKYCVPTPISALKAMGPSLAEATEDGGAPGPSLPGRLRTGLRAAAATLPPGRKCKTPQASSPSGNVAETKFHVQIPKAGRAGATEADDQGFTPRRQATVMAGQFTLRWELCVTDSGNIRAKCVYLWAAQ